MTTILAGIFGFLMVVLALKCDWYSVKLAVLTRSREFLQERAFKYGVEIRGLRQMLRNAEDEAAQERDTYTRLVAELRKRLSAYDRPKGAGGKFVRKG